jgi:hypothetical protein
MRLSSLTAAFVLFSALGCGGPMPSPLPKAQTALTARLDQATTEAAEGAGADLANTDAGLDDKPALAGRPAQAPQRKIIHNGDARLIVDDFDQAEGNLLALVKEQIGYVAKSMVTGNPGSPRQGTWTVRVPAGKFDEFMAALPRLGELQQSSSDSRDITDHYQDTQAEIKNLEAREEALRKLYTEKLAGTKLTDLLEVSRELNNVRTEIDTRKGRLQRWDKEVAFATIVISLQDRRGYVPPIIPDFGTSIGRTFQGSMETLLSAGRGLVLGLVAAAPWVAVLLVPVVFLWLVIRSFLAQRIPRRGPATISRSGRR